MEKNNYLKGKDQVNEKEQKNSGKKKTKYIKSPI